jgi:hypothetical protein
MALPSKVKPGDPIKAADWNALVDFVRASQVSPGAGVRIQRTASGTTLAVDLPKSGGRIAATLPVTPFQVVLVPSEANQPAKLGVNYGHIINALTAKGLEEDNASWGLWSGQGTDGAFEVPATGEKIWLEITLDSRRNIQGISIRYGAVASEDWENYPDPIGINTDSTPFQEFYRELIAEVSDPDSDSRDGLLVTPWEGASPVKVVQALKNNLLLVPANALDSASYPGLDLLVTLPHTQPGTVSDGSGAPIVDQTDAKTPWEFGKKGTTYEPFAVRTKSDPNNPDTYLIGVESESRLFTSKDWSGGVPELMVDGLIYGDSDGWTQWNGSWGRVWLEVEFGEWPEVTAASIKSDFAGDEWSGTVVTDGEDYPTQTSASIVLATVDADGSGAPVVTQYVRDHLEMTRAIEKGEATDGGELKSLVCAIPAALEAASGVPPWLVGSGTPADGHSIAFGAVESSFVPKAPDPLKAIGLRALNPQDETASSISLVVGDDNGTENDELRFQYGDSDAPNKIKLEWVEWPKLTVRNTNKAEIRATLTDSGPEISLNDNYEKEDSSNRIKAFLDNNRPWLALKDENDKSITAKVSDDIPEISLEDEKGGTKKLSLAVQAGDGGDGPQIKLLKDKQRATLTLVEQPSLRFDDEDTGSYNELSISKDSEPSAMLYDQSKAFISSKITDGDPEVDLQDASANEVKLAVEGGSPTLYLTNDGGSTYAKLFVDGSEPNLYLSDGTDSMSVQKNKIEHTDEDGTQKALFVEDGENTGDLIAWNAGKTKWVPINIAPVNGAMLYFDGDSQEWLTITPDQGSSGAVLILGSDGKPQWLSTSSSSGAVLRCDPGSGPFWDDPQQC